MENIYDPFREDTDHRPGNLSQTIISFLDL